MAVYSPHNINNSSMELRDEVKELGEDLIQHSQSIKSFFDKLSMVGKSAQLKPKQLMSSEHLESSSYQIKEPGGAVQIKLKKPKEIFSEIYSVGELDNSP